ncbi:DUF6891 domain-containing protein [Streptosporangium sp. V21-05]|uniref:DUF6891 domain-containing protein n=1 Tax=Streptosporangium sp. V21-05 TaxID=3446115 RepID=UPI003F535742
MFAITVLTEDGHRHVRASAGKLAELVERLGGRDDRFLVVQFHSQCMDSAAAGHGLTLLYGGLDGSSDTTASIGREVVAALGETGLPVEWDGDPSRAITVVPLDWRKRLVG